MLETYISFSDGENAGKVCTQDNFGVIYNTVCSSHQDRTAQGRSERRSDSRFRGEEGVGAGLGMKDAHIILRPVALAYMVMLPHARPHPSYTLPRENSDRSRANKGCSES